MTLPFFAGSPVKTSDLPPSVGARDDTSLANLSNTSFEPGSPEVGVNFIAPPSGYVLMVVGGGVSGDGNRMYLAGEVRETDSSGSVVSVANNIRNGISSTLFTSGPPNQHLSRLSLAPIDAEGFITPLVPGAPYHARVMHAVDGGTGADVSYRDITIIPLPLGAATSSQVLSQLDNVPTVAGGTQVTAFNLSNGFDNWQAPDTNAQLRVVAPSSGRMLIITAGGVRDNTNANRVGIAPEIRQDSQDGRLLNTLNDNTLDGWERWAWVGGGDTATLYQYGCRAAFIEDLDPGRTYFIQTKLAAGTSTTGDPAGVSADVFNQRLIAIGVS